MRNTFISSLTPDTTVVTVTQRLAVYLRQQYDAWQIAQGKQVWLSLDVLPIHSWVERCWQNHIDTRIVLNDFQELTLWQRIINQSNHGHALLRVHATAKSAQQAWGLLQQWNLTLAEVSNSATIDAVAFVAWAKEFIAHCEQHQWLDQSRLPSLLTAALQKQQIQPAKHYLFAGFDQIPPQLQNLLQVLQAQTAVNFLTAAAPVNTVNKLGLNNTEEELYAMARFAQQHLTENPPATIGCVVPDLTSRRDQVDRIFNAVFRAHNLSFTKENTLFNISAGKIFSDHPLIQSAFTILQLNLLENPLAQLDELLLSPFIDAAETEINARALLVKALHERGEVQLSLRTVLALAQQSTAAFYCPQLALQLQKLLQQLLQPQDKLAPNQWVLVWQQKLQSIGWPGERSLHSHEYQQLQRWQNLLLEFCSLNLVTPTLDSDAAITLLQQLAGAIIFQPQSAAAPVQIMGALEAAGLQFDALWVMGADDQHWPPHNNPNPFIPFKLQHRLGMPHANPTRELNFYHALTTRLSQSAAQVIFSYPQQEAETVLRVSPLLAGFPAKTLPELNLSPYQSEAEILLAGSELESWSDSQGPAFTPEENIRGGSQIFKLQAACPFKAFAKLRLRAEELEAPQLGLNKRERGKLLHEVMERLWLKLVSQEQLLQLNDQALIQLITTTVTTALQQLIPKKPLTLKKYFTAIEQLRLEQLVTQWLQYEKQRPPFTVLANEHEQTLEINQIPLRLRIDRIDQLADGAYLIIDYKTNESHLKDWFGPRPDEPQLPLYCITQPHAVDGLAFAQVCAGKMGFKGIAETTDSPPGIFSPAQLPEKEFAGKSWTQMLTEWRTHLTALADDFCAGNAAVDPKDLATTCEYCEFKILCRVHEVAQQRKLN